MPQYKHCNQVTTSQLICYERNKSLTDCRKEKVPLALTFNGRTRNYDCEIYQFLLIYLFPKHAFWCWQNIYYIFCWSLISGDRQVDVQYSAVMKLNHSDFVLMQLHPRFLFTLIQHLSLCYLYSWWLKLISITFTLAYWP